MEHRIMTDKDVSKKTLSDNNEAEKKEPATSSSGTKNNTAVIADKKSPSPASVKTEKATKHAPSKANTLKTANKSNKTATVAITLAMVSIFASIGHYIWQQQQTSAQLLSLSQQNQQAIQQSQAQLKNSLSSEFNTRLQQQLHNANQSQQSANKAHLDSDAQIQRLSTQVAQLEQQVSLRQPSDWLIHEAEYLVRVAARTMWLERDTKAAIGLLRDADSRLKELDQPKFLPIRALINEDIESLALMPTLENQQAILTLLALNKQVPNLTLANVNLAEALEGPEEDFSLSDDVNDWQANLAKTWQKFLNDFITVRRRTGMVEPLMTPNQQQHLRQNLSLKVQLVQWAASEQKAEIYQQTLLDIQQWLNEYFDMTLPINQKFYQSIEQLKQKTVHYDYPSDLSSLAAIKRLLDDTKQGVQKQRSTIKEPSANKVVTEKGEDKSIQEPALKVEPTKTEAGKEIKSDAKGEQASGGQV